jgi:hypothetical protein
MQLEPRRARFRHHVPAIGSCDFVDPSIADDRIDVERQIEGVEAVRARLVLPFPVLEPRRRVRLEGVAVLPEHGQIAGHELAPELAGELERRCLVADLLGASKALRFQEHPPRALPVPNADAKHMRFDASMREVVTEVGNIC